ncbi:MAG: hypothetical protein Q8L41_11385 [Anaerolineales bacterium]|nr:hypothetical protein [Anaerolineales bacterium]
MANKLSANVKSFQKRWNANWDDATAFIQFKNRLLFLIDKHLSKSIVSSKELINQYAFICGLCAPYSATGDLNKVFVKVELEQKGFNNTIIYSTIANSQTPIQVAWYLQNLFTAFNNMLQNNTHLQMVIDNFYTELVDVLSVSPVSQIRLSKNKKGIIVYPAGAKLLDDVLVNENLTWLLDYPESHKAFEQALSIYFSGDKLKFRNLVDNLRVAIEQLLRRVLGNEKSFENQTKELSVWLEKRGVHSQTKNLFSQLLFGPYAVFQNDAVKHGDEDLLPDEIEYLIYLTGTFLRLLIQLNRNES